MKQSVFLSGGSRPRQEKGIEMADSKTVIYKDKLGEFRWRRTATNGEIIGASSESYKSRKDCEANASRNTAKDKWEFFKDKGGKHRWRALSNDNGRQVGKATEGFSSRKNAESNAKLNGWKG
jgi:uncharacterized protein YegP (UPF0339 family)